VGACLHANPRPETNESSRPPKPHETTTVPGDANTPALAYAERSTQHASETPMTTPERDPTLIDAEALLAELLAATRRRLWLHARVTLLAEIAGADLGAELAGIARRHRHTDIRLLVDDDLALKEQLPSLVESIKRLPSAVSVRRLEAAEESPLTVTAIADHSGWMQLTQAGGRRILRGDVEDRPGTQRAAQDFEANWSLSDEAVELRRLLV